MSDKYMPKWASQLQQQASTKKSIIIDGNINDLFYENVSFQPLVSKIYTTLKDVNFDQIIGWDKESGISNFAGDKVYVDDLVDKLTKPEENSLEGENYETGDDNEVVPLPVSHESKSIEEYFTLILKRLGSQNNNDKIAFIIDWSDSIFGNINGLSQEERDNLMLLEKAVRNSIFDLNKNKSNNDIIILLTPSISYIPPKYYQNNKSITTLHIPVPNRVDRKYVLNAVCNQFNLLDLIIPDSDELNILNDSLDGMTVRDIVQLIKLSKYGKYENNKLSMKKLRSLYRYGDDNSPWEDLDKSRIYKLEDELKSSVMGQDHVIKKIYSMVIKAFMGLSGLQHSSKQQTPKGVMFFVGPTGVGKTELAKSLARFLFGDEESYVRFDMSEYNHENSDQKLIGAPPGYVGYEEGGQLTNAVRKKPFSVLLFDEIEKAHPRILDKFLQILEDGRLTDGKGELSYFTETVIIFTSNIGASDIDPSIDTNEVHRKFIAKVKEHFNKELGRPELLNRIGDNIIPFNFIKETSILQQIIHAKLINLKEKLREKFNIVDLTFENDEIILFITEGHDQTTGGRGVLNLLSSKIIEPLSDFLFNEYEKHEHAGKTLIIKKFGNTKDFTFEFK